MTVDVVQAEQKLLTIFANKWCGAVFYLDLSHLNFYGLQNNVFFLQRLSHIILFHWTAEITTAEVLNKWRR